MGRVGKVVVSDAQGTRELAELAASLGVVDALLFRRVSPTTWAHLGGLGRGRGWAGIIDINHADDPLASRIPPRVGGVLRVTAPEPERVLGPYYATGGAIVRASRDVAVVLGNPREPLPECDDDELRRLAELLEASIDDVLPSKRLADELEVLNAVRALMQAPTDRGLTGTLQHVVTVAAQALTCEVGALLSGTGQLVVTPPDLGIADEKWRDALAEIESRMGGSLWCLQDVSAGPPLQAVTMLPGVRSLMALRIPPPTGGLLMAAHTDRGPRGFTSQCMRLGQHVADTASLLAHTAALRDDLLATADRAAQAARTDPLTELGNRLAWEEAVTAAQEQVDAGRAVSVLTLDLDGLKTVNDKYGHDAGDGLLRRCAAIIRSRCRREDVAVRMGGDEFAILLPVGRELAAQRFTALAGDLGASTSGPDTVAASIGVGTAEPGGRVADAMRDADVQMYENKRNRRRLGARKALSVGQE